MFDVVLLTLRAGEGGHGKISFRREKFIPKGGPDGGHGGDGGNIWLEGSRELNTLQHFAGVKEYRAEKGQNGGKQQQIGHKGEDLVLKVPVGTTIWLLAENKTSRRRRLFQSREGAAKPEIKFEKYVHEEMSSYIPPRDPDALEALPEVVSQLPQQINPQEGEEIQTEALEPERIFRSDNMKDIDIRTVTKIKLLEVTEHGQRVLLCEGGLGGRGNTAFKSSVKTTPVEAEYGTYAEEKIVLFELTLLADVGLIGYPNAGKSTLLSVLTKANPKVANYPFTTLEPNLGIMSVGEEKGEAGKDLVLADIPGLIEGASQGKGLGFQFLRHVQACKVLLFVLSLEEAQIFDEETSPEAKAQLLIDQLEILQREVKEYGRDVEAKPQKISLSKSDLYSPELLEVIKKTFAAQNINLLSFSSVTRQSLEDVKKALVESTSA